MAELARRQRLHLRRHVLGPTEIVEIDAPVLLLACERHLDPHHPPAFLAHDTRDPIDIRHDLAGIRRLPRHARGYVCILQVNDDQCRRWSFQAIEDVKAAALSLDAFDDVDRGCEILMHCGDGALGARPLNGSLDDRVRMVRLRICSHVASPCVDGCAALKAGSSAAASAIATERG